MEAIGNIEDGDVRRILDSNGLLELYTSLMNCSCEKTTHILVSRISKEILKLGLNHEEAVQSLDGMYLESIPNY